MLIYALILCGVVSWTARKMPFSDLYWRVRFCRFPGKACGVPRDGNVDKKEESELLWTNVVESQSAFLGPNLWDNKTIPYDNDLKVSCIHMYTLWLRIFISTSPLPLSPFSKTTKWEVIRFLYFATRMVAIFPQGRSSGSNKCDILINNFVPTVSNHWVLVKF